MGNSNGEVYYYDNVLHYDYSMPDVNLELFKGKIEHVEYSKGGQEFCAGGQDKSLYVVRESAFNVVGEGRQRDAEKAERWERERRTYETRYNIGSQCFDCKYLGGGA